MTDEQKLGDALNTFLAALPQQSRVIFLRRYWFCDTAQEIAARCGIPCPRVKRMLQRLRQQLEAFLEAEELLP